MSVDEIDKSLAKYKQFLLSDYYPGISCGGCGVREGELHQRGCDMEVCPECHGQAITCDHSAIVFQNDERIPFWMFPNLCTRCGELWPETFTVLDEQWQEVVPPDHWREWICQECYSYMAQVVAGKK